MVLFLIVSGFSCAITASIPENLSWNWVRGYLEYPVVCPKNPDSNLCNKISAKLLTKKTHNSSLFSQFSKARKNQCKKRSQKDDDRRSISPWKALDQDMVDSVSSGTSPERAEHARLAAGPVDFSNIFEAIEKDDVDKFVTYCLPPKILYFFFELN